MLIVGIRFPGAKKRTAGAVRFPRLNEVIEGYANIVQERNEAPAQEVESENRDNSDKSEDESVFRETLSFLAAKD